MAGNDEQADSKRISSPGDAGPLSRLLQDLAGAPDEDDREAGNSELRPGDQVGRFAIRRELGRGGFGVVYEAYDPDLNRGVAVKLLRLSRSRRARSAEWLRKEAEAIARLDHACILTLFDVGTCPSGAFLVMELLRGQTLAQRLAELPLSPGEAQHVAEETAKGLAHAHQRGVLHLDLKPANVFVCEDGRVKILDFGLARLLGGKSEGSGGTPAYMAPEQAHGGEVDERADVYAAGKVLGEMLGGKRPRRLEQAVASATSADPAARPRDGKAWLDLLQEARRASQRPDRIRRLALLASAFLLLGAVAAGLASWRVWRTQLLAGDDGRIAVAVADFANQTGDPDLDGLSGLLITSLEQSKRLRVLTRSRMWDHLRDMGKEQVDRIDEPLAREIGNRAGARALLLASVRKMDDVYAVEMRAFDPRRDEYLFTVKDVATGKKGLLDLIDRLSDRTRAELREASSEIQASGTRVGEAVTSRLDAYEHFFRAGQYEAAEKPTEALEAYRRAVSIDPGFAQAHLSIALLLRVVDPEQSNRALAEALRHVDRLPEKERLLIRAQEAGLGFRTEEALGMLERVSQRWPDDPESPWLAGDLLISQRGDFARGLALLERSAMLDPTRGPSVIRIQLLGQRFDEALQTARRFAEQHPGPSSLGQLTVVLSARGEEGPALEAARRAVQAGAAPTLHLLHAYLRAGAMAEAEALVRARMAPDRPVLERRDAFINLAVLQGVQGRMREGLGTLDAAAIEVDGGTPSPYLNWARAFFLGGTRHVDAIYAAARAQVEGGFGGQVCNAVLLADLGQAWRAEELTRGYAETPCAAIVRAVGSFRGGRREEAFSALERLRFPMARYYQGKLLAEERRDAEAIEALRTFRNQMTAWLPFFAWAYPESLYLSAAALERRGEMEPARQEIGRLLTLWAGADSDIRHLDDARAMQGRLAAQTPAR